MVVVFMAVAASVALSALLLPAVNTVLVACSIMVQDSFFDSRICLSRAVKPLRTVEDIMLKEQELADQDAEAIERDRKARADADAALMALNNPANTTADNAEAASTSEDPAGHAAATNTADSMELCSTAELVELFAEYTEADEQQKREDYLVSECRLMVDIDFADESLDRVTDATVPIARVALGDSNDNEEYDLDNFVSRD